MTNIIPLRRPRELAHVLADILMETAALERATADWYRTRADEASDRAEAHAARCDEFRNEAVTMVEQSTGVTWDALVSAVS